MNNIEKFRVFRNLKQTEIADVLDISLATYRILEKRPISQRRYKDQERIKQLANYYNINIDELAK